MSSNPSALDSKTPNAVASSDEASLSSESRNGKFSGSWLRYKSWNEERKLLFKMDAFILSWACYGYFIRLLDTSNISNAYVSGLKEDLNLIGDEFNYFGTYWTVGYIIGMIPGQVLFTRFRPSVWLPVAEIIWAIITFSFAAVKTSKQIYAMRFLIGFFEAPFYVGTMTLLGNWYTPKELAKRATIFYSASYAANMFSGYLQAAVYSGLNGHGGLAGWRWLFIMCGVITVPGAIWGFFAVPDSPYNTKAFYLTTEQAALAKSRMIKAKRLPFEGINFRTVPKVLSKPFVWVFVVSYIFFCLDTNPVGYFGIYLKSLNRFSVPQINTIPTAGYGFGLIFTISMGILSDKFQNRTGFALFVVVVNLTSCALLASNTSIAGNFVGYMVNGGTNAYGPLIITYLAEIFSSLPDERALILGIAQTFGATFNAWVPLVMFNTKTQAPYFKAGFLAVTIMSALQAFGVVTMWYLGTRILQQQATNVKYPTESPAGELEDRGERKEIV